MAAQGERGFFYRTTDPIQNLHLRLRLRQVHSRATAEVSSELLTKTFRWQEKVQAPWEIAKNADPDDLGGVREACVRELEAQNIYIYTYIDQDDFVPAYEREEKKTTSGMEDTPIAECMTNLPDRFATLSNDAEEVQQRVTREGNFQIMYVMAVVAVDPEKLRSTMMTHRDGSVLDGVLDAFDSPWKRLKTDRSICQEHVRKHTPSLHVPTLKHAVTLFTDCPRVRT